jgi:hypothetical protein
MCSWIYEEIKKSTNWTTFAPQLKNFHHLHVIIPSP